MKNLVIVGVVLAILGGLTAYYFQANSGLSEPKAEIDKAEKDRGTEQSNKVLGSGIPEVSNQQFVDARQWIQQNFPNQAITREAVLMVLAERAVRDKQLKTAVKCYQQVPTSTPKLGMLARLEEGKLLVELNMADEAESALRQFIDAARVATQLDPQQVLDAFKWLTYILSVEIRQEDRCEVLKEQHLIGLADPLDSKQLFFPNLLILNSPAGKKKIAAFLENSPDNLRLQIANARYRTLEGSYEIAIETLTKLREKNPKDLSIAAVLAEAYFESADSTKLAELLAGLPEASATEPWLLRRMRGEHALENKQWSEAIEHFEAVLQKDPANAPSQMGCAKAWTALGNEEKRVQALLRSGIIAEIRVNLSKVQSDAQVACNELASKCKQLGMADAATVFERHAITISQQPKTSDPSKP